MGKEKKMFFLGCLIILMLISFSSITFPIFVSQTLKKHGSLTVE